MTTPVIVGIDEAGRGALAGPVSAAACVMNDALKTQPLIQDSKKLLPEQREEAYEWILQHCIWGASMVDASDIDEFGILACTEKAMQQAVAALAEKVTPSYLLVDGRDKFWFDYPHSSVIKGDEKELCISAASIIAKVQRDRLMVDAAGEYPGYKFDIHKGYGTADHFNAVFSKGFCALHRRSFMKYTVQPGVGSPSSPTSQK